MRAARLRSASRARPVPALLLVALVVALLPGAATAGRSAPEAAPRIDAASWLLIDLKDQAELTSHAPTARRAIASTTKLMTAYLALHELKMDRRLVVPAYRPAPAESVAGLIEGERLTVHDLIVAMMLPSANDAAITVAEGVSGSERAFVDAMNSAAAELGLTGTSYANPIGLDARGNYSTAEDLATLAQELLADKRFRRIVAMPKATLNSGNQPRVVTNTNTLLFSDPTVDGVKTGHTTEAGYVLVASAKRRGVPLLAAVLGAPSEAQRDADAEQLLDYGYSLYDRDAAVERDGEEASAAVRYEDEPLSLVAARGIEVRVRADQKVNVDVEAPAEVEGPVAAGAKLGAATVTVDGRFIDRTPLVAARAVDAPTIIDKIGGPPVAVLILVAAIVILAAVVIVLRRRSNGGGNGNRDPEERMRTRQERIRTRRGGDEG
jgi:D-alanyl-D-alanine carboxypeptidase (penicillin-binding protein 5/6)